MKPLVFVAILALCLGVAMVNVIGKQATAKAYATTRLADQRAANIAQARKHREITFELEQAKREAVAPHVVAMKVNAIYGLGIVGLLLAVVIVGAVAYTIIGVSRATVKGTQLRAQLIPLDAITRQYPLLVHETKGRFYLVNPNTGDVAPLNQTRQPIEQLVAGSQRVQMLGVEESNRGSDMVILNRRKDSVSKLLASTPRRQAGKSCPAGGQYPAKEE